ncbi:hypothetical protein JRG66_06730 [Salinimicrobium tongyeongense]|jgi:hypothetical protein|uniref:FeoB-associated Cys-rich membrane protein n=1 Tax=Salinimicrobium tongyeongense TaxID=2809707 RepID=A0ABY6NUV6_9FLAO|nr:hypothetical protein [Salinimicrobium tongyeongense]UZH56544.1 hypothetical protein JRG66_06730 [Salinimicrobium tongyeongense]
MELLQEILVFITFTIAVGYMFTKFVYKPKFLYGGRKKTDKACGTGCKSCH